MLDYKGYGIGHGTELFDLRKSRFWPCLNLPGGEDKCLQWNRVDHFNA